MDRKPNNDIKRIYRVYKGMKERCYQKKHVGYRNYGAKGIEVLCSWHEFKEWYLLNLKEGMNVPNVDRIDPTGNYELSNMQLISAKENSQKTLWQNPRWDVKNENMRKANASRKKLIVIKGIEYESIREANRKTGIDRRKIKKLYTV